MRVFIARDLSRLSWGATMELSKWFTKRWVITISPVALKFSREGETLTISGSDTQGLTLQRSALHRQICGLELTRPEVSDPPSKYISI